MGIYINAFPQTQDDNGKPGVGWTVTFYESGSSTTKKTIFQGDGVTPAANPQVLEADGGYPDEPIVLNGLYNVILRDELDVLKRQADPVFSFESSNDQLSEWNVTAVYDIGFLVRGTDGCYYQSQIEPNTGNDPVIDPVSWSKVRFLTDWNPNTTYSASTGLIVGSDNNIYKSKINNNTGNNPVSSPDEWGPAINLDAGLNVALPVGYKTGYTLSNGPADLEHDITMTSGAAKDSTNTLDIVRASTLTKAIDSNWVEGTNNGGFPTGISLSPDTCYHYFVIVNAVGNVDAGFDTDLSATNLLADATGYTGFRRVGSVRTDASSNIEAFLQEGSTVYIKSPTLDVDVGTQSTAQVEYAVKTPLGVKTTAILAVYFDDTVGSATGFIYVHSPDVDDLAPSITAGPLSSMFNNDASGSTADAAILNVLTNTLSQVSVRANIALDDFKISTHGWIENF